MLGELGITVILEGMRTFDGTYPTAEKIPGYHMPDPSAGYVEPLGTGFRFVPVSYQFLI
jgi:hypothetical protein